MFPFKMVQSTSFGLSPSTSIHPAGYTNTAHRRDQARRPGTLPFSSRSQDTAVRVAWIFETTLHTGPPLCVETSEPRHGGCLVTVMIKAKTPAQRHKC